MFLRLPLEIFLVLFRLILVCFLLLEEGGEEDVVRELFPLLTLKTPVVTIQFVASLQVALELQVKLGMLELLVILVTQETLDNRRVD